MTRPLQGGAVIRSTCPAPRTPWISWSAAIAMALFLCGVVLTVNPSPASADETGPRVIRIAGSAWVADKPTRIAHARGLFERHLGEIGREVRLEELDSGLEALQAMLDGRADFALAASTPVALQLLRAAAAVDDPQGDIVILASLALSSQTHHVIGDRRRGIESPADLAGRRVGVMFNTSGHFGLYHFAAFHGLDLDGMELIDLPVSGHGHALREGQVDAVVNWDPWAERILGELGNSAIQFDTRQVSTVDWLLVTRRELAESDSATAGAVLAAYRDAIEFMRARPDRAREIHAGATGISPEVLGRVQQGIIWNLGLHWSVVANVEAQFDWFEGAGIAEGPRPSPARYLYAGPLEALSPRLVELPPYLYNESEAGVRP